MLSARGVEKGCELKEEVEEGVFNGEVSYSHTELDGKGESRLITVVFWSAAQM